MVGEIIGPDILIILLLVLVLFGGSQIPKLARGLGSAQREFHKGLHGHDDEKSDPKDNAVDVDEVDESPALTAASDDEADPQR